MIISIEEHVARAIFGAAGYRYAWDDGLTDESKASYCAQARAAIAVMRGPAWYEYLASIRESERAACEAIAWEHGESPVAVRIARAIAARKCKGEWK